MRGTNSGGKVKVKTRSLISKPAGKPKPAGLTIFKEVDAGTQSTRQKMFTFATLNSKQFNKITKKVINRDYMQIIATRDVALSFADKWARDRKLEALYLVAVEPAPAG